MNALIWVFLIAGGFLMGSIMFCKIIPKRLLHKDISELSYDHNPGHSMFQPLRKKNRNNLFAVGCT